MPRNPISPLTTFIRYAKNRRPKNVKKAFFYCRDCVLPADAANKVYWIRVTAEGTNFRSSTKCCNTLMTTASLGPVAMRPFNRNGLYNFDGSRFEWT